MAVMFVGIAVVGEPALALWSEVTTTIPTQHVPGAKAHSGLAAPANRPGHVCREKKKSTLSRLGLNLK